MTKLNVPKIHKIAFAAGVTVASVGLGLVIVVLTHKISDLTAVNTHYERMLSNPYLDDIRAYGITELRKF